MVVANMLYGYLRNVLMSYKFLAVWLQENRLESPGQTRKAREANIDSGKDGVAYSCLLKNELLRASIDDLKVCIADRSCISHVYRRPLLYQSWLF